ncbi:MAG: hypothetical protein R3C46_00440 [Hyphomonadaceae bacterium]
MQGAEDYELKAQNYATAAFSTDNADDRLYLLRLSALCRARALRIRLGPRAHVLDRPTPRDKLSVQV